MSQARQLKRNTLDRLTAEEKLIVTLAELSPPMPTLFEWNDEDLDNYYTIKYIVMRYQKPFTLDMLFHPLSKKDPTKHLYSLSTFDRDFFLHIVRYATREGIDATLLSIERLANIKFLIEQQSKVPGLVLRPLFEKISQKVVDFILMDDTVLSRLILDVEKSDVLALLKRVNPKTFKMISKEVDSIILALIKANVPAYVDIILPHLPIELVQEALTRESRDWKPMDNALLDYGNVSSILDMLPVGSKQFCSNEAAVRIVELLPKIPPIYSLFRNDSGLSIDAEPLTFLAVNNRKLLNALLRRASSKEILQMKDVLIDLYPYLDEDVAKQVYVLNPTLIQEKNTKKLKKAPSFSFFTMVSHPLQYFTGATQSHCVIKAQRYYYMECFQALPAAFNRKLRSITLAYAAENNDGINAIQSEVSAMFAKSELKKIYQLLMEKLVEKDPADFPAVKDPAKLVMQYSTPEQHLYILEDEIEEDKSFLQRWLPSYLNFSIFGREKVRNEIKNVVEEEDDAFLILPPQREKVGV